MKSDDIDRIIEGMTTNKNSLRKAAEMALKYFQDAYGLEDAEVAIKEALRQALAHEALDEMVAENQRLGLYDTHIKWHDGHGGTAMNDLRKAAEALIEHWEAGEYKNCTGDMAGHIRVLREAAAQPEWVGLTDEVKANWKALGLVGVEIVAAHLKEKNT